MIELVLGLALITVFNILVLFYKAYRKKYLDLAFDLLFLVLLAKVLGGSTLALAQANVASFFLSVILFFIPMEKIFPFLATFREWREDIMDEIRYG